MNTQELVALAQQQAEAASPHRLVLRYTPPLPKVWPPSAGSPLVIFGYARRSAPTGRVLSVIHSPRVAVTIEFEGDRSVVSDVELREGSELPERQARPADPLDPDELLAAGDALLRVITTGQTDAPDMDQIRSAYTRWQTDNPVLASHLTEELPAFFAWLDSGRGG